MSKTYTLPEVVKEIATTIKNEIAAHEASLVAMRKKELERSHGKLAKSETLCPLCAEPDVRGKCGCLKLSKSEKLAKKTPPDISEKTMHKLKDEYGHDEKGKEKAYATAWSIENKMKKDSMDAGGGGGSQSMMMSEEKLCKTCGKSMDLCKCMGKKEVRLDKAAMASSSASALAPKPEHNTPVAHVNKEMGGFKSIATKAPISSMGRPKASASGSFTTVKAEMSPKYSEKGGISTDSKANAKPHVKSPASYGSIPMGVSFAQEGKINGKKVLKGELSAGKAENYSEEANGGATKKAKEPGVAMPSTSPKSKKPGKLPVPSAKNYSEKANGNVMKMELKTKPDVDVDDSGSGGETKKGPSLKKTAMPSVKQPAVQGTAGKQPVGLGGGDANKIAGAPHPATTAGLADVKGLSPAGQWKGQGLPQLKTQLASVRGGVGWLKSTHAKAARVHPAQAAPKSQRFHGALPLQRGEMKANKMEVPPSTEGLSGANHNRKMLKV